jgi:hypothetical protein
MAMQTLTIETRTIKLSDIVFDPNVYVRHKHDPQLVQQYARCLDSIEARRNYISVAADMRLVDGRHRQLAYLTAYPDQPDHEIAVYVHPVTEDDDVHDLACELNSEHGWQMSEDDKRREATKMYMRANRATQEYIAGKLRVRLKRVNEWLSSILKQEKEERDAKIWSMWLACHGQQKIADTVGLAVGAVNEFLQDFSEKFRGKDSEIFRNFEPKIYTVWNFGKLTNSTKVFGSIPQEIIDNLLYYYTKPFDVVFDPFGGGGSTIDRCVERKRRYFVSDLTPIPARDDIRQWDITQGLPDDLPVPDLVFLDPPYWKQAEGEYSDKLTDLGNVDLDVFLDTIGNITKDVKRKWGKSRPGARLALIIGARKYEGEYIDLPLLCYQRIAKYLQLDVRIQVPYSTQVHNGNYVKMAKEAKELLYLSRDLMVFKL